MKDFLDIFSFAEKYTNKENLFLKEIRQNTLKNFKNSHMISGEYQGRFLSFLSKLINPKAILEIGTFIGYSTICLAEGLKEDGTIHTIELNSDLKNTIEKNLEHINIKKNIKIYFGNALEIIDTIMDDIELVFIDANKKANLDYYELSLKKLKKNGLIITDNVWYKGKISQNSEDKIAKSIKNFLDYVISDKRTNSIFLPIRDGLLLSLKV